MPRTAPQPLVEGQVASGLEAFGRVFFETVADNAVERGQDISAGLSKLWRFLFRNCDAAVQSARSASIDNAGVFHSSVKRATKRVRRLSFTRLTAHLASVCVIGNRLHEKSLALIGNVAARKCRGEAVALIAETFSMRRLGGSRWRLRRTR